jgi:hypothetical protein
MNNILNPRSYHNPRSYVVLKNKVNADKILENMIKSRRFQTINNKLRYEANLQSNINNYINERDRLKGYIQQNYMPSMQKGLIERMHNIDKKINSDVFKLYVLGKTEKLI